MLDFVSNHFSNSPPSYEDVSNAIQILCQSLFVKKWSIFIEITDKKLKLIILMVFLKIKEQRGRSP